MAENNVDEGLSVLASEVSRAASSNIYVRWLSVRNYTTTTQKSPESKRAELLLICCPRLHAGLSHFPDLFVIGAAWAPKS